MKEAPVFMIFFLGGAAAGAALMALAGAQALVAVFSSLPLAKRRKRKHPDFDLNRALRRILGMAAFGSILVAAVTAAVLFWAPSSAALGYLLGMIVVLMMYLPRMSPNNPRNQRAFYRFFADCDLSDCSSDA